MSVAADAEEPPAGARSDSRRPGLFLVLEGIEGAGKTTQNRRLGEWMEAAQVPHALAREPGGTPVGEDIREILLSWKHASLPVESELLLILAARAAFVRELVQPALERGEVVLADRFALSTFAYQGFGRGIDLDRIRQANEIATGGLKPDAYLLLDLEIDAGLARQRREGKEEDRIEGSGADFFRRVLEGYRTLASRDERIHVVDASGTEDEVHESIRGLLVRRFPETFG